MKLVLCEVLIDDNNDNVDLSKRRLGISIIDFDEIHHFYPTFDKNFTTLCNALGDPIFTIKMEFSAVKNLISQPIITMGYNNYERN